MKRYNFFCSYDGGGPADAEESADGDYVLHSEAAAELESLRRDAARYRFLRAVDHIGISPQAARDPVAYDAAIDAATTGETR